MSPTEQQRIPGVTSLPSQKQLGRKALVQHQNLSSPGFPTHTLFAAGAGGLWESEETAHTPVATSSFFRLSFRWAGKDELFPVVHLSYLSSSFTPSSWLCSSLGMGFSSDQFACSLSKQTCQTGTLVMVPTSPAFCDSCFCSSTWIPGLLGGVGGLCSSLGRQAACSLRSSLLTPHTCAVGSLRGKGYAQTLPRAILILWMRSQRNHLLHTTYPHYFTPRYTMRDGLCPQAIKALAEQWPLTMRRHGRAGSGQQSTFSKREK